MGVTLRLGPGPEQWQRRRGAIPRRLPRSSCAHGWAGSGDFHLVVPVIDHAPFPGLAARAGCLFTQQIELDGVPQDGVSREEDEGSEGGKEERDLGFWIEEVG